MILSWQVNFKFTAKNEKWLSVHFDSPIQNGGEETALSPMENVLASLAACSSHDIISIMVKKRQKISHFSVEVIGERRNEQPRVFTKIQIKYIIIGMNINEEAVRSAVKLSEEYCTVGQMLRNVVKITSSYEILDEQ